MSKATFSLSKLKLECKRKFQLNILFGIIKHYVLLEIFFNYDNNVIIHSN